MPFAKPIATGLIVSLLPAALTAAAGAARDVPRFEEYPVRAVYHGRHARVNLRSDPLARQFRTRLREGARTGPNFAGHYTVVTWGCGTECQMIGIVDLRNGRVHIPKMEFRLGTASRANSSLLVANPPETWREVYGPDLKDVPNGPARTSYYRWDGRRLILIKTVNVAPQGVRSK